MTTTDRIPAEAPAHGRRHRVCMTLSGIYKFTYGRFIGENWLHQSVYSPSLIGIGAAIALCALIPAAWINRATRGRRFHL